MLDLLLNRRSIRKYQDKTIEKEKLDEILRGALTSPSGKNIRPWELIVVTDKEVLNQLGQSRGGSSRPLGRAPLAIVVVADTSLTDVWVEDASIISIVIQLTAHSLGLGSCWIQTRKRFTPNEERVSDYVKSILNIPEKYEVESMIAIGYPDEEKSSHNIEALPYDKIHYEKF